MSEPLSVVHALAWPGEAGGMPRSMTESLAALRAAGVDARAWLASPEGGAPPHLLRKLASRGIPVTHRHSSSLVDPDSVSALTESLRALEGPVVLHTHGERALGWGCVAALAAGVAQVHSLHGAVIGGPRSALRVGLGRALSTACRATVAVDESVGRGLASRQVVPNTIDAEHFAAGLPSRAEARRILGLGVGQTAVLFLGRLSREKGADRLPMLAEKLAAAQSGACLVVAGGGPEVDSLQLCDSLRLLGATEDAGALLRAADVVVMPSRSEGCPMVALEAASLGVPVVAFGVGALAAGELCLAVREEEDGLEGLAASCLRAASAGEQRTAALDRSRRVLETWASPATHAARLVAVYGRALQSS